MAPRPDDQLARRAQAGREAIRHGCDPALILSYVVWPPAGLLEAEANAKAEAAADALGEWEQLLGLEAA